MKRKRIPRWLAAAATMLGRLEPSTPKPTARSKSADMAKHAEDVAEPTEAEVIADFNALQGTYYIEDGQLFEHVTNDLERDAHKRDLKKWQDLDAFTMMDLRRMEHRFRAEAMIGEGFLRALYAAEDLTLLNEKLLHVKPRRDAHPNMLLIQQLGRQMRGME